MLMDPCGEYQVINEHLKQASIVNLRMAFNQPLQHQKLICKFLDLLSLFKHFQIEFLHNFGLHFLVLCIQVIKSSLDDICAKLAKLLFDIVPDSELFHQMAKAFLHCLDVKFDLCLELLLIFFQECFTKTSCTGF